MALERFTEDAQDVLVKAMTAAREDGGGKVDVDHIRRALPAQPRIGLILGIRPRDDTWRPCPHTPKCAGMDLGYCESGRRPRLPDVDDL